ncbi:MAG TPA: IS110 family transposase [Acidimicrobiia bacterium]|nr:IS110 family transposase [Acidimicrobiia bacterium]
MMVVFGVDAHKRSHTVVAVDQAGVELDRLTVPATAAGHLRAVAWAGSFPDRRWGIEDCRHVSSRFEADLLAVGEMVVRVPPRLMAQTRKSGRQPGKSDPIDALAVARAVLSNPDLPHASLEGPTRELKLLLDYRESLIRERTAAQNRLRWRLHELEPGFDPPKGSLDRYRTLNQIDQLLDHHQGTVADLARRETNRIRQITKEANQLQNDITALLGTISPTLTTIPGCGPLTGARLLAEAADISRFRNRDAYAMFAGTAPIPVWTSNQQRFRLNRGGNRQTNAALHRIAITQLRIHPPAQQLVARHTTQGKTKQEALRNLKRRLTNIVYRTITQDQQTQNNPQPQTA